MSEPKTIYVGKGAYEKILKAAGWPDPLPPSRRKTFAHGSRTYIPGIAVEFSTSAARVKPSSGRESRSWSAGGKYRIGGKVYQIVELVYFVQSGSPLDRR